MATAPLKYRPQLVPVNGLGDRGARVAAQVGDVFDVDTVARQERDEAVPQLARCAGVGVEPGFPDDRAEGPQDVVQVQGVTGAAGEDELVAGRAAVTLVVGRQGRDAPLGQGQR